MNSEKLQTPIDYLKGVGPNRADILRKELGIHTYQDLLNFFPFRYIDKTRFYKINELQRNSSEVQVIGKITAVKMMPQKRGKRLVAVFEDDTGSMELTWFRGHKWIRENIKTNVPYVIFGKTNWYNGMFSMPHPEMDLLSNHEKKLRTVLSLYRKSWEKRDQQPGFFKIFTTIVHRVQKRVFGNAFAHKPTKVEFAFEIGSHVQHPFSTVAKPACQSAISIEV